MRNGKTAVVRGGGDLATGIIYRLWRVGYSVLALETALPLVVRRTVSVASAVFDGRAKVEDMSAVLIGSMKEYDPASDVIQVLVDPEGRSIREVKPDILVDAVMAKKNIGTTKDMAPTVIAVGPGFSAPGDVDAVIETKRGHTLGRVIRDGSAIPNTGVPGIIKGYGTERLLRAPADLRPAYLALKSQELLLYLWRQEGGAPALQRVHAQQTEQVRKVHAFLVSHLDRRYTIEDLSRQFLLNTATLKSTFKAVYGQPIATYMKEARVREAMRLLRETDSSIADIAAAVGYESQGKFTKAFKDVAQALPTEYRRQHRA